MKKNLSLITIIFILMVYSITGYKVFGEEFIIPIKYNYNGELLSNATHYIHSFSLGNNIYTYYRMKLYKNHPSFEGVVLTTYNEPYRDGTNFIVDVDTMISLRDIFYMRSDYVLIRDFPPIYYSFHENYLNNPSFRKEIKRLVDFLDRSGSIYDKYDLSITFNDVLNERIKAVYYLEDMYKYYKNSDFIKKWHESYYGYYKWKFQVGKKKFRYGKITGNIKIGEIFLSESSLNEFQAFLDKKKINLKLSEHIKYEADDIESGIFYAFTKGKVRDGMGTFDFRWKTIYGYRILTNYFEGNKKTKYYILDLKDFVIGEVETPYWLY